MKAPNYIVALVTIFSIIVGCKDTASKPAQENAAEKKEVVVQKPETATFKVDGMTCAIGCAKTIEEKLSKMDGVQNATVDFDKKEATVDFDAAILTSEKITKAVETIGDGETYKVSEMKTRGKV